MHPSPGSPPSDQTPAVERRPAQRRGAGVPDSASLVAIAVGIACGAATLALAAQATRVIGWLASAMVAATFMGGVIGLLDRKLGHRLAVLITATSVLGGVGVVVLRIVRELQGELQRVQVSIPAAAERLERGRFSGPLREFGLADKVRALMHDLPRRLGGGSASETARLAGTRGAAFIAGLVLTCFLCAGGRRSFDGLIRWLPERPGHVIHRHSVRQMVERAHRRTTTLLLFAAGRAIGVGAAASLLFRLTHVPGPTILGLAFAVASLVPGVGVIVAGIVSAVILAGFDHGGALVVAESALGAIVVADQLLHAVGRRHGVFDIGPALGTAAFFAGFELGGLGSAICALAFAGFGAAVWAEFARTREHWAQARGANVAAVTRSPAKLVLTSACIVAAGGIGLAVFRATQRTAVLALIALVVSLALEKGIGPLSHRLGDRRRAAVAMVGFAWVAVLAGGTIILAPLVAAKTAKFKRELPRITERFGELPLVGTRARKADVSRAVQHWLDDLPRELGRNSARLAHAFWGATDALVATLFVLALALALVIDGPRLLRSIRRPLSPAHRRTFDRSCQLVLELVGRYFAGSLLVAVLAGLMALVVGLALGVLLAPLIAAWVMVTNVIPQVGGLLGGTVLVAAGFATSNTAGVVCLAYFLTYQQIENHIIQPTVIGKAVSLSPAATMVIALVGGSTLGVPGALIAVPVAGAVRSVVRYAAGDRVPAA